MRHLFGGDGTKRITVIIAQHQWLTGGPVGAS
ncbi:hypothetical protein M2310_002580 [Rhizobium leguminosarum]|uniref:Uncharacterized protein n=1 Tax=Rhizobium esperanzae TaxID=1967781 RepID=A0A7W6UKH7_9HYPH|nr:hypothetical protein [Rhizobium esperanzae]MDH6201902.1 hypothetical protein [Rhizobium leguminosarum]